MSYGKNTDYTTGKQSHLVTDEDRKEHDISSVIEGRKIAKDCGISYEDMNKGGIYEHSR